MKEKINHGDLLIYGAHVLLHKKEKYNSSPCFSISRRN